MRAPLGSAVGTAIAVAIVAMSACGSFDEAKTADGDAGVGPDGAAAGDGGGAPDAADGSNTESACAPPACTTGGPFFCTAFDSRPPAAELGREPGGSASDLWMDGAGCKGGGMVVTSPAVTGLASDLFFIDIGPLPAKVHVDFDFYYEVGAGQWSGDPSYIDFLEVSTAPRSGRMGSSALALGAEPNMVFATISQPPSFTDTNQQRLTAKTWHHIETTTTFGASASLHYAIDGVGNMLSTSLAIGGMPAGGASIAFGRSSNGEVPAVKLVYDNVRIRLE